ncbi:MAG TPA: hypothetical protein DCQ04_11290, partial [Actinobacteria bacterium]|nr:hypothetical protein [Actinomycetota bacterium]
MPDVFELRQDAMNEPWRVDALDAQERRLVDQRGDVDLRTGQLDAEPEMPSSPKNRSTRRSAP